MDTQEVCWICLDGAKASCSGGCLSPAGLELPCRCPRPVHRECLARWQLQSAGKQEEKVCRFCKEPYPDWRTALTGGPGIQPAAPVMAVFVKGKAYKIRVQQGPGGQLEFQKTIKRLMGLPDQAVFDVVFDCKAPNTGERLQLRGLGAFDAAAHCAAVSAAKRKHAKSRRVHSSDSNAQALTPPTSPRLTSVSSGVGAVAGAASSSSRTLHSSGAASGSSERTAEQLHDSRQSEGVLSAGASSHNAVVHPQQPLQLCTPHETLGEIPMAVRHSQSSRALQPDVAHSRDQGPATSTRGTPHADQQQQQQQPIVITALPAAVARPPSASISGSPPAHVMQALQAFRRRSTHGSDGVAAAALAAAAATGAFATATAEGGRGAGGGAGEGTATGAQQTQRSADSFSGGSSAAGDGSTVVAVHTAEQDDGESVAACKQRRTMFTRLRSAFRGMVR